MPQIKIGKVASKTLGSVVVEVASKVTHPLYKKQLTKTKRFKARNEIEVKLGQIVKIIETKPVSKDIHFKVMEADRQPGRN